MGLVDGMLFHTGEKSLTLSGIGPLILLFMQALALGTTITDL
jgi:hypothetical protein